MSAPQPPPPDPSDPIPNSLPAECRAAMVRALRQQAAANREMAENRVVFDPIVAAWTESVRSEDARKPDYDEACRAAACDERTAR